MMDGAAPQATQGIMGKGNGINQQMWLKSFGPNLRQSLLTPLMRVLINVAVATKRFLFFDRIR